MSQVITKTHQESSIHYHLSTSIDEGSSTDFVNANSARTIPVIRVRESATGGSQFVDDAISLDVLHALGELSHKISVDALQFRYLCHSSLRVNPPQSVVQLTRQRFTNTKYGSLQNSKPHNAPARQFVITLNGTCLLTVIDKSIDGTMKRGESRVIKAGDLLFVEDVAGTGHYASNGEGTMERYSLFLPVGDGELVFGSIV